MFVDLKAVLNHVRQSSSFTNHRLLILVTYRPLSDGSRSFDRLSQKLNLGCPDGPTLVNKHTTEPEWLYGTVALGSWLYGTILTERAKTQ